MSSKTKIVFSVLITFSLTCLLFTAVLGRLGLSAGGSGFKRLDAVAAIIQQNYIGEFDRDAAEDAAIEAIVASIGDPYSVYYDGESASSFMNTVEGSYVGIGVEIYADPQTKDIVVISAYDASPAKKAGMKSGDIIVAVDGESYNSETLNEAVLYMKGAHLEEPVNTPLTVTVKRGEEFIDMEMLREEVDLYRIGQKDVGDGLLYLRYTGFSEDSAKKLGDILETADEKYKGIIFDLRENPGGDLDAAVEICDMFLDDGMIMYTEDKNGNRKERNAHEGSCGLPLAVLVDGGSASASEIFAGCIQARGRGIIIGEKTYGKGVSQVVYSLGDDPSEDGVVKITGLKNYRPDGIWLNEAVTPDIEAENNATLDEYGNIVFDAEGDKPLAIAIEELSK